MAVMKRVFVLTPQSMFGQGVVCLLEQEAGLEIVGQLADLQQALSHIQQLQPAVVILDMDNGYANPRIELLQVLTALPNIRVIGLSLNQNTFQIFQANQKDVHSTADLIDAIAS